MLYVVWVSPKGKKTKVEVSSLQVHESDHAPARDRAWDLALLVLKTPIKNGVFPCLDLDGSSPNQPPLVTSKIGVMETWRGLFISNHHILFALSTLSLEDCRAWLHGHKRVPSSTDDVFCTIYASEMVMQGTALLVQEGGSWFLRGIICHGAAGVYVFTDLNGDSVRNWLREKLHLTSNNDLPEVKTISPLPGARHFFFEGPSAGPGAHLALRGHCCSGGLLLADHVSGRTEAIMSWLPVANASQPSSAWGQRLQRGTRTRSPRTRTVTSTKATATTKRPDQLSP
ncbi:uncharacterized protein LOC117649909 [Thrips palmi]|uniref:Uncharacterized protein LOC117649909 n=1 Tax=Thrips palmi TaxID=161013 RepID=A0A6P8ZVQ3_THRPL|nr:uncharacterized protein LOC117649909 [Thrips palmi]